MASLLFLYICIMKILICDKIDELGEDFVERCKEILPEWRKEQMLKIKHLRGRVQCALGWMLATLAEKEDKRFADKKDKEDKKDKKEKRWRYNEHGKPYFEGRNDLFFSISHCGSAVAVAFDDEEVGVDIEEVKRYREHLVNYVLNEEEKDKMDKMDKMDKKEMFIEIWTKKEAVFKLLGTGITHEIKDILKNNSEINVVSKKVGGRYLSVATRKVIDNEDITIEFVNIEKICDLNR